MNALVPVSSQGISLLGNRNVPQLVQKAGPAGTFTWEEFFLARISNPHTRVAYERVIRRFLGWVESYATDLAQVTPAMVGVFLRELKVSPPSQKLALSALRSFFQLLTERHLVVLNPAASVRSERFRVDEGRTPEITPLQSRTLLQSIDVTSIVGTRDKAVIATLIFTAARAGAVANLKRGHLQQESGQWILLFREKNGVQRKIPVRHDLQLMLQDYLDDADLLGIDRELPLFRSFQGRSARLSSKPITAIDICRMVKKRCHEAGLSNSLSPHGFRVGTITDLLKQGVPLEDVSFLAGHADMRTTRLYDRRQREVTRNIVERISV